MNLTFLIKQINVSPFNQMVRGYAKLRHQISGNLFTDLKGIVICQYNLQLKEMSQIFHPVQVDARPAGEE
jgi:hypothetical protein